jgi:hypothetical protein
MFDALRLVAVWLLAVSLLLGPIGPADPACSCDCDDEPAEHEDEAGHDEEAGHDDDQPCDAAPAESDRECQDGCCGAGPSPSVALAMAGLTLSSTCPRADPDLASTPTDDPAAGVRVGVFRPPRSVG